MNDKNEKTMNEKYEKKIQADVDAIFTLMAQRVDEKQMNLLHEAYDLPLMPTKTNCASLANPISVTLLPWHALWQKSWSWEQTLLWQLFNMMLWRIVRTV